MQRAIPANISIALYLSLCVEYLNEPSHMFFLYMKHHGKYELPSVEEFRLDIESGGCSAEYIARQVKRYKQKYHNDKRHKQKQKRYERRIMK